VLKDEIADDRIKKIRIRQKIKFLRVGLRPIAPFQQMFQQVFGFD